MLEELVWAHTMICIEGIHDEDAPSPWNLRVDACIKSFTATDITRTILTTSTRVMANWVFLTFLATIAAWVVVVSRILILVTRGEGLGNKFIRGWIFGNKSSWFEPDSRETRRIIVDSSSSNRDIAIAKVGRGPRCWIKVTKPAYAFVRPEISFRTNQVLVTGESTFSNWSAKSFRRVQ